MNLLDIIVTKIVKEPYQRVDEEFCCWEVVVETDRWGQVKEYTLQRTSKKLIDLIQPGYSWLG